MKIYKIRSSFIIILAFFLSFISLGTVAHASVVPTISLSNVGSVSSQISIYGDPNSSIELHYGPGASVVAPSFGTTDQSGNFTTVVNTSSYNISCNQTAYIIINGQLSQTISWSPSTGCTTTSSNISFSQNNITLTVGQTQTVTISGTGGYSVTNNTNTNVINTSLNGNVLSLYAAAFGGSNITVCQSDGQCSILYVVAISTSNSPQTSQLPSLSSFTVSSNNTNGGSFMSPGNVLTISFSANKQINNVLVVVGTSNLQISGSNNGPYTATYTVPENEPLPIPVRIKFSDTSGNAGLASFDLGNVVPATVPPTIVPPSTPVLYNSNTTPPAGCTSTTAFSITTGQPCGNPAVVTNQSPTATTPATMPPTLVGSGYVFSKFLYVDLTGSEVSELQKRLTALGFYSGPITGRFGPLTESAVKKLQKAHGINQAGYVGPGTRAVLNQY